MGNKITPPKKPEGGKIPPPPPPSHSGLSFSFKYFNNRDPFLLGSGEDTYPLTLLERLRDVCRMSCQDMKSGRSSAIRCHPIDWADTTQPEGFEHLNKALREQIEPYQFSVSANVHGRVHGFFIEDVFYLVWLDPEHKLYDKK